MRFMSLFSGMGGFDLALEQAGMECVLQAESDPQCLRVLAHHWPDVERISDVRSVGVGRAADHVEGQPHDAEADTADALEGLSRIDLICGGFPCQDVSVAGRRAGLDGARSGLWFEFQRIVSELLPTYVLIENVPGLLSSNQGRDFAIVLHGLAELGYGVSWRVLDSRHFGVAQRRRRVFIVAGPPDGRTEAILALAEGCPGHLETGGAAGEAVAGTLKGSARGSGTDNSAESADRLVIANPVALSLGASTYDGSWKGADRETYIPEVAHPVNARDSKGVNQREDVMTYVAVRTAQTGANGIGVQEDEAYILDGTQQAVTFADVASPVVSSYAKNADVGDGSGNAGRLVAHALTGEGFDASEDGTGRGTPLTPQGTSVRRLTPTECLRLQGFPDDWLDLDPPLSDGPKYRMCGNAITVPVVRWIGERMMAAEKGVRHA